MRKGDVWYVVSKVAVSKALDLLRSAVKNVWPRAALCFGAVQSVLRYLYL